MKNLQENGEGQDRSAMIKTELTEQWERSGGIFVFLSIELHYQFVPKT